MDFERRDYQEAKRMFYRAVANYVGPDGWTNGEWKVWYVGRVVVYNSNGQEPADANTLLELTAQITPAPIEAQDKGVEWEEVFG